MLRGCEGAGRPAGGCEGSGTNGARTPILVLQEILVLQDPRATGFLSTKGGIDNERLNVRQTDRQTDSRAASLTTAPSSSFRQKSDR